MNTRKMTWTDLIEFSHNTTLANLRRCVTELDKVYGQGWAEKNPVILTAYLQAVTAHQDHLENIGMTYNAAKIARGEHVDGC